MALPFNWEPFFPVKLAMGMSVEGLVGVLSLRNGSIYIKRLKSLSHYQSSVTEFPRERMNQRVLVFSWAWQITKLSGDSFFFFLFQERDRIFNNFRQQKAWKYLRFQSHSWRNNKLFRGLECKARSQGISCLWKEQCYLLLPV